VGGRWPQDVTATPRRAFVNERVVTYALLVRARGIVTLARASAQDLFDQKTAFGRLALVHVIMMAGDTLVTVSLAGSLFFSVSPTEAKGKVLLYLLLTIAPFAVVSPILGPLIDRSANGRRILVAISAGVRAALCWMMAEHLNSLWLFPLAFLLLISSKLYVVTRGALVPEMARTDQFREHGDRVDDAGWPNPDEGDAKGYAGFNAQLTLLGTLSGLIAGSVGAGILKGIGAPSVLYVAAFVYIGATVASARLQKPVKIVRDQVAGLTQSERDLNALNPLGDVEVAWGLGAASLMRFSAGFTIFLLAFGLRRESAGLGWYAFALLLSAGGSLVGLAFVTRVRNILKESTLLTIALLATGLGAALASVRPVLAVQVLLAGWLGLCGAIAQPSFDAITQKYVAPGAQGRTFARFAVRQQLLWVVGALIPVAIAMSFSVGDRLLAILMVLASVVYPAGRRSART
jgi:MFS family permease